MASLIQRVRRLELSLDALEGNTKPAVDDDTLRAICELRDAIRSLIAAVDDNSKSHARSSPLTQPSPDPPTSLKEWWELVQPLRRSDCTCIGQLVRVSWEPHEWDCPRHGHVITRQ